MYRDRRFARALAGMIGILVMSLGIALITTNWQAASAEVASRLVSAEETPTPTPSFTPTPTPSNTPTPTSTPLPTATPFLPDVSVRIEADKRIRDIPQAIYGVAGASKETLDGIRAPANAWTGDVANRYNLLGAGEFNAGRGDRFWNAEAQMTPEDFLSVSADYALTARFTVPTIGYVASDKESCSFLDSTGRCVPLPDLVNCLNSTIMPRPDRTSSRFMPSDLRIWAQRIADLRIEPRMVAMGHEPELWGVNHYDVHPDCTTYREIFETHVKYATVIREEWPATQIVGPGTCCWEYFWDSPAGEEDKADNNFQDFLPWYLAEMRRYQKDYNLRMLDALEVQYHARGLTELTADEENSNTESHRLRATRSLWDPTYSDESNIVEPIYLIPRMNDLIARHYPGLKFGIGAWDFGADHTMNGALAIADTLGIFGVREVDYAFYDGVPAEGTPGWYAFRMFTNFDGRGGRFGDVAVSAESTDERIAVYSSVDRSTDNLHIVLISKYRARERGVVIDLDGYVARQNASLYRYDENTLTAIDGELLRHEGNTVEVALPPYSITHLVLSPATEREDLEWQRQSNR